MDLISTCLWLSGTTISTVSKTWCLQDGPGGPTPRPFRYKISPKSKVNAFKPKAFEGDMLAGLRSSQMGGCFRNYQELLHSKSASVVWEVHGGEWFKNGCNIHILLMVPWNPCRSRWPKAFQQWSRRWSPSSIGLHPWRWLPKRQWNWSRFFWGMAQLLKDRVPLGHQGNLWKLWDFQNITQKKWYFGGMGYTFCSWAEPPCHRSRSDQTPAKTCAFWTFWVRCKSILLESNLLIEWLMDTR